MHVNKEKKDVKFKEEEPKENKAKIDEDNKKLRLSKRLEQAKKRAKEMEEKNKFRKSEVIKKKAAALETKMSRNEN